MWQVKNAQAAPGARVFCCARRGQARNVTRGSMPAQPAAARQEGGRMKRPRPLGGPARYGITKWRRRRDPVMDEECHVWCGGQRMNYQPGTGSVVKVKCAWQGGSGRAWRWHAVGKVVSIWRRVA